MRAAVCGGWAASLLVLRRNAFSAAISGCAWRCASTTLLESVASGLMYALPTFFFYLTLLPLGEAYGTRERAMKEGNAVKLVAQRMKS